jgi:hypothetical protein
METCTHILKDNIGKNWKQMYKNIILQTNIRMDGMIYN